MLDTSDIIRISIQNDMVVDNVTAKENDENDIDDEISSETLHNVDDSDDAVNEPPNKHLKLQMPAFMQPKAPVTWKTVTVENPERATKLGIETICPNICMFFLHDDCVEGAHCYNLHELPSDDIVRQRLIECGFENMAKLFHVMIARCPKLLQQYFHLFIDIFAEHQLKNDLIDTICICERERNKDKRFTLFQQLIQAFIKCGETYKTTMEIILFNVENVDQGMVDTLLNMNLVDGIDVNDFLGVFESLNKHRYAFNEHIINRLMFLCTHSVNALPTNNLRKLARLIFDILKRNIHVQKSLNKIDYNSYKQLINRYRNQNGQRQNP